MMMGSPEENEAFKAELDKILTDEQKAKMEQMCPQGKGRPGYKTGCPKGEAGEAPAQPAEQAAAETSAQ